jgi:hypothetical protein
MRQIGLPITILRPMAFMELMTDKDFYPQVSVWHVMPKLMGCDRTLPWLAADDVGVIASKAFDDPERFVGADIPLAGDLRSLVECRQKWSEAGRPPRLLRRASGRQVRAVHRADGSSAANKHGSRRA